MNDQSKEYRKLSELKSWDKNPRTITKDAYERLKWQIEKLGMYKPSIINQDNIVLGGNMRLKAYAEMGIDPIWVSPVVTKNESEMWEYALSDNDHVGVTDMDMIVNEMPELDIDWSKFSVDIKEPQNLQELINQYSPVEEDEVPEVAEGEPISKLGEVYQLGRHRLMCGDATKAEDVQKLMNGQKAQMVFTYPPYNVDYQGGMNAFDKNTREGIMNDKMSDEQFYKFLDDSISNMMAVTDGIFYICMSSKEIPNLMRAFENAGGHWQSFIIWVKNQFTISRSDYQNQYEPILYGWNKNIVNHYFIDDRTQGNVWHELDKRATFDGQYTEITLGGIKIRLEGKVNGQILKGKRKIDIWRYDKPNKSVEHPTMKPIALCAEAIRNSSKQDDIVLDVFGGSGSTLIASEQTNRTCYTMELDPKYCDVIRKRYENYINNSKETTNGKS